MRDSWQRFGDGSLSVLPVMLEARAHLIGKLRSAAGAFAGSKQAVGHQLTWQMQQLQAEVRHLQYRTGKRGVTHAGEVQG